MTLAGRFRYYFTGVFMGCLLVFFTFGDKVTSCFNTYLPNGRVLDEISYKKINYTPEALAKMTELKLDTLFVRKTIFAEGVIDFGASKPRNKPCGNYLIRYTKNQQKIVLLFDKCKEAVLVKSLALEK